MIHERNPLYVPRSDPDEVEDDVVSPLEVHPAADDGLLLSFDTLTWIGWSSKAQLSLIRWPSRPHPRTGQFDDHLLAHHTDSSSRTFFCAADPPDKQLSKAAAVLQLTTVTWAAPLGRVHI